jgi:hypothetical protein
MLAYLIAAVSLISISVPEGVKVVTLDAACHMFAYRLSAAQKAGDNQKALEICAMGMKRIASKLIGGSCPNVKAS